MSDFNKKHILCVVGTRPEAIKMAPVILALQKAPWCRLTTASTGQHRQLTQQALDIFNVKVDVNLDVMVENQRLSGLAARILQGFDQVLLNQRPDLVLVQGDTTTVMATALCCFHTGTPVGHVEAGLRTGDIRNPFPEEFNRRVATLATQLHFAPTPTARAHLLREGISATSIFVTGNPVIDALLDVVGRNPAPPAEGDAILVTMHRRENFNAPMSRICDAIVELNDKYPNLTFNIPVHPNPTVRNLVYRRLDGLPRVRLTPPVSYDELARLIQRSRLILTDSGGIQEEAPALKKPVLVLRAETERPEAVEAGVARLVGADAALIVSEVDRLLTDPAHYTRMASGASPYGDGRAAARIANYCAAFFGIAKERLAEFA